MVQENPSTSPRRTVVVAEDESIIRMDLTEILEEQGYEVLAACGRGDEAIELVRTLRPDVALLDIKMPVMDGLTAARAIAAEHLAAVVILTSFSQPELVGEASSAGVDGYVVKPFQASDVVPAIEVAHARFVERVDLRERAEKATVALENRKILDRAKGLLMDRNGVGEQVAFRFLQSTAMSTRSSLAEVAQRVIDGTLAYSSE
jgi:response regulator NasT